MDVHENSLDEDTRRFVSAKVFETLEDAKETLKLLISQYGSEEGPLVYAVIKKMRAKTSAMFSWFLLEMANGKSDIMLQKHLQGRAMRQKR